MASCLNYHSKIKPFDKSRDEYVKVKRVQFKSDVMVFVIIRRDSWKFKCETHPLRDEKIQKKMIENVRGTYRNHLLRGKQAAKT